MGKRDKFDYFDAFEKQTEVAVQEAELLIEAIESFTEAEHLRHMDGLASRRGAHIQDLISFLWIRPQHCPHGA